MRALWIFVRKLRGYRVFVKGISRCAVKGSKIDIITTGLLRDGWEEC